MRRSPGYETTIEGLTITNRRVPEETSVTVTKAWDDDGDRDGRRPQSVRVQLKADGRDSGEPVELTGDAWSHTFGGLPKYRDGREVTYTVTEEAVPDYSTAIDGLAITNKYTPQKTSVTVTKAWDDDGDRDGLRPESVEVQLLADGAEVEGRTATLSESNSWTATFSGLNQMSGGKKITYTVSEQRVEGYEEPVITGDAAKGFTITNEHAPEETSVRVTKVWDDERGGCAPDGRR